MASIKKERLIYIDLIRIIACVFILTVHFNAAVSGWMNGVFVYPNSIIPNYYFGGVYLGDIGSGLFFIISGVSLAYTYPEEKGFKSVWTFYKKRFSSIFPAFWTAYVISFIYSFLKFKYITSAPVWELVISFLGLDGYLWSVGRLITGGFYQVGEWFLGCLLILYLFFPLLLYGVKKGPVITTVVVVAIYAIFLNKAAPIFLFVFKFSEMLFGAIFTVYGNNKLMVNSLSLTFLPISFMAFFIRGDLGMQLYTLIINISLFLLLFNICRLVKLERLAPLLKKVSYYTFPAFLVHHRLIFNMVIGFDLTNLGRRYTYPLFFAYIVLTIILSFILDKLTNKLIFLFKKLKEFI